MPTRLPTPTGYYLEIKRPASHPDYFEYSPTAMLYFHRRNSSSGGPPPLNNSAISRSENPKPLHPPVPFSWRPSHPGHGFPRRPGRHPHRLGFLLLRRNRLRLPTPLRRIRSPGRRDRHGQDPFVNKPHLFVRLGNHGPLFQFMDIPSQQEPATLDYHDQRFSPGWSVGWWFIPALNLLRPYQVIKEIWRGSYPNTGADRQPAPLSLPPLPSWAGGGQPGSLDCGPRKPSSTSTSAPPPWKS